jgi:trigger factor
MKTELVDISPTRKEIKIEIEQEAVRAAYDSISARYSKQASVPGFRPGHAPVSVVRKRFKDEIRSEVLRELVPQAIQDAIDESALEVIGEPDVHLDNEDKLNQLGEGPLSVHVHIEILPQVELGQYKGLAAERRTRPVTDEDVENVIQALRESSASLQPVEDRPSQEGDTVTVNFRGKFLNEPEAEEINVEEVEVELGGENVYEDFTENLTGVKPDDERTFTIKYPADFTSKGLAGKDVEYTAKVTGVSRKELPELDDEWARSLNDESDSVATLREKIREDLEKRAAFESDNRLRNDLLTKLVAAHPFEVPETLIEHQSNHHLESVVRDMLERGMDPRSQEMDWAQVRDQLKEQAVRDVRSSMLLETIAERENLEVTDEEINAEIESFAQASRQTPQQVRDALTKQGGERSIGDRLRNRKALDLLLENASVTDAEWREETPEETEAEMQDQQVDQQTADSSSSSDETQTEQSSEEADQQTSTPNASTQAE